MSVEYMEGNEMSLKIGNMKKNRRTLLRGVCRIACMVAIVAMLPACGGGGDAVTPPIDPAASLRGAVSFTPQVPLGEPPVNGTAGPAPSGTDFIVRIVDPGDDIGGVPIPIPGNVMNSGEYEFGELDDDPLTWFNLLFTVEADLEGVDSIRTIVSLFVPIALAEAVISQLSCTIHRPFDTVLQVNYIYEGPDGAREGRLRLDFVTDLLTFDLDGDGVFDDLIGIDRNHDAIVDDQVTFMRYFDPGESFENYGLVTEVGSNTIVIAGISYQVWGSTNASRSITGDILALSEIGLGGDATITAFQYNGRNIALNIDILPDPIDPSGDVKIVREGVIESIDDDSLFIDGIRFSYWLDAQIVDLLGIPIDGGELDIGMYAAVIGVREGEIIRTESITIEPQVPESQEIEREGPIISLDFTGSPTELTIDSITFSLTAETEVSDISGDVFDLSYLLVGTPVHVVGYQIGNSFVAELIELKYDLNPPGVRNVEVVVIVVNEAARTTAQAAIDGIQTDTAVELVFAPNPAGPDDAPCISDALIQLYDGNYIDTLNLADGFMDDEAFPIEQNGECSILMLMEGGRTDGEIWIEYLYPDGFFGYPFIFDYLAAKPYYGAPGEYEEAGVVADVLDDILGGTPGVAWIYVSSDLTFSE